MRAMVLERLGEVNETSLPVSEAIGSGASEADIRRLIRSQGIASRSADAFAKVRDGITSFDEAQAARWH